MCLRTGGTTGQEGGKQQRQHKLCVRWVGVGERLALLVHTCRAPTSFPCAPTHLFQGTTKEGLSPMDLMVTKGLKFGLFVNFIPKDMLIGLEEGNYHQI